MSGSPITTLTLGAVAIAAIGFAYFDRQTEIPISMRETVIIDGLGVVTVPHDFAAFNFSVETIGATPLDALQDNNELMQMVLERLHGLDISDDRILTRNVDLGTLRNWVDPDDRTKGQITTYRASNSMQVRFTELDGVGLAMTAVAEAGATDIGGPYMRVEDFETPYAEARELAIRQAREDAEVVAAAAGRRISRVIRVDDPAPDTWEQDDRYYDRNDEELFVITGSRIADPVPIHFGEEDVTAFVRVTFELE